MPGARATRLKDVMDNTNGTPAVGMRKKQKNVLVIGGFFLRRPSLHE
jgi:hypothetical protein